ncbi:MAG: RNA-binding S4 domain-containing protein, partial [Gillisia sp.]|nr:RNA-binding S4 domain-containing protein [Gillisia sp.]
MRVDKFLWCVRYFKTRSLATNATNQGKVKIKGAKVKPSREVYVSDIITIRKNQIEYQIEVLELPPSRVGAKLVGLYINDITPKEAFAKLEL